MSDIKEKLQQLTEDLAQQAGMAAATVLIVEDKPARLKEVIEKLPTKRYVSIGVNSTEQVVECLRQIRTRPQAAIVDCILRPGGGPIADNGIKAVKAAQNEIGEQYRLPVFLYTSEGEVGLKEFEAKAKQANLDVRRSFRTNGRGLASFLDELLQSLDKEIYKPRLEQMATQFTKFFEQSTEQLKGEIHRYRQIVGDVDQVKCFGTYEGEVISYHPPQNKDDVGEGQILFEGKDYKFAWSFQGDKFKAADADFEGAKVRYDVYVTGPTTIATLQRTGPDMEQTLKKAIITMSQKDLEELSK